MFPIVQLLGRSPFAALQKHMEKVAETVHRLHALFHALVEKNSSELQKNADAISELEHAADVLKNDIRKHLTSSLLRIDRANFLEILALQDRIADCAEDISVLVTLRSMHFLPALQKEFLPFLQKNIACFDVAHTIIRELQGLIESSFGGVEAEKVRTMCDEVSFLEHEADVEQHKLLKCLYALEPELSYGLFFQWQKVFETTGAIANLSEKLSDCVRMTLDNASFG